MPDFVVNPILSEDPTQARKKHGKRNTKSIQWLGQLEVAQRNRRQTAHVVPRSGSGPSRLPSLDEPHDQRAAGPGVSKMTQNSCCTSRQSLTHGNAAKWSVKKSVSYAKASASSATNKELNWQSLARSK